MTIDDIKRQARLLMDETRRQMAAPYYQNTMAWLVYLGLLRHNTIQPRRTRVTLEDLLAAGNIEPRIYEILPALMLKLPEALKFKTEDVPNDLKQIVKAMRHRRAAEAFRGVAAEQYMRWLRAPVFALAARRLHFRSLPRRRESGQTAFAESIKKARMAHSLTQAEMAEKFGLSLRVIRDLEQGKLTASLTHVISVLQALDQELVIHSKVSQNAPIL